MNCELHKYFIIEILFYFFVLFEIFLMCEYGTVDLNRRELFKVLTTAKWR